MGGSGGKWDVSVWHAHFLDIIEDAFQSLWKYVGKHMDLAKHARILDPTAIGTLSKEIGEFPPTDLQGEILQSGQWRLYRESVRWNTSKFDFLEWWEAMPGRLPLLHPPARRILAIHHASCDVEWSSSVWKRCRSEKSQNMQLGMHKAYVLFCLTGFFQHHRLCGNQLPPPPPPPLTM